MKNSYVIAITVIIGIVLGTMGSFLAVTYAMNTSQQRYKDFYDTENLVSVSPATIKQKMDTGVHDYILVDLRSAAEYDQEHIIGAINIPGTQNITSMVDAFRQLPANKDIILYCYSAACTLSRQVGQILAQNGIFAKHLNIGWSEWRYHWDLWNPESNVTENMSYIQQGSEPGVPVLSNDTSSCYASGGLGC